MGQVLAENFIRSALANGAISFPLKSVLLSGGRMSPHVFNSAFFNSGRDVALLGDAYAQCVVSLGVPVNVLFGMAYKGITIATSTVTALWSNHGRWITYAHDRKEEKQHNEKGMFVGASMKGQQVVLVDDTITSGGSCARGVEMIKMEGGELVGLVVGLDRQEQGASRNPRQSALQEFSLKYHVPTAAVITLQQVIDVLIEDKIHPEGLQRTVAYRAMYGARC